MGRTMQARADQLVEACSLGYLQLTARFDELSEQLAIAMLERDSIRMAKLRLDRAMVEMHLRDLWGPWSNQGHKWNEWMWDDLRTAMKIADELADEVGDDGLSPRGLVPPGAGQERVVGGALLPRLMVDYPRLRAVMDLPA